MNDNDNKLINLASSTNRASIAFATDEWFATAEHLLNPAPPTFVPDLFCPQGKVMDGWETRRRRAAGHDWCVIKLGAGSTDEDAGSSGAPRPASDRGACVLSRVEVDTAYFTGNQAPRVSLEAMKVTRPAIVAASPAGGAGGAARAAEPEGNDDYLYEWMPGAATRLARGEGGRGVRGTGQSPTEVRRALEACRAVARRTMPDDPSGEWITVLPMTKLRPGYEEGRYHHFEIPEEVKSQITELGGVTHLKLNYYPDGGVARMKVYGHPCTQLAGRTQSDALDTASTTHSKLLPIVHPHGSSDAPPPSARPHPYPELSSELHGGRGLACSNRHYGVPANLLRPRPGADMGDGWETARHPDRPPTVAQDPATGLQDTPLRDWCVLALGGGGAAAGAGGGVSRVIVDTRHFKGNSPESVTVEGRRGAPGTASDAAAGRAWDEDGGDAWFPLVTRTALAADAEHEFLRERGHIANGRRGVTHVRISITPDGGLSRVRIYGAPAGEVAPRNVPLSHL